MLTIIFIFDFLPLKFDHLNLSNFPDKVFREKGLEMCTLPNIVPKAFRTP